MEYSVIAGKFGVFYVNPGARGDGLNEEDRACLTPFNTIYSPTTPLMQFTGLRDKNGNEIYEGDIVRKGDNVGQVHYSVEIGQLYYGPYFLRTIDKEEAEIIGNIYENPDLLK